MKIIQKKNNFYEFRGFNNINDFQNANCTWDSYSYCKKENCLDFKDKTIAVGIYYI